MPRSLCSIKSLPSLERRPRTDWEEKGWWGKPPLWRRVRDRAKNYPSKTAVIDETGNLTYAELWEESVCSASVIHNAGLERGQIVLVQLPNWREFAPIMLGCELANTIFAFCPITWGPREVCRALNLLRPSLWITSDNYLGENRTNTIKAACNNAVGALEPVLLRGNGTTFRSWRDLITKAPSLSDTQATENAGFGLDPLEVAVTSGTTGVPKGVVHAHDTVLETVQSTIERQGISSDDVIHLALPVGHTFGYLYGVRCALQAGGTLVMQESWDPYRMAELVKANGVTVTLGTAAFIIDLLNANENVRRSLKGIWLFTQSGDTLPESVIERAMDNLPFRISRALGMTEFGHVTSTDAETPRQRVIESTGTPQREIDIIITDDQGNSLPPNKTGRILVRGPAVCAGYLIEDGTVVDVVDDLGFFDTGDLGSLDTENYLQITGRRKNVLRRGAETVPISDLEEVLCSHPQIIHAVIVGLPDNRLGELPLACVQICDGSELTIETIRLWFDEQGITRKFWPTDIYVVRKWPTGPTGKIDRRLLQAAYQSKK